MTARAPQDRPSHYGYMFGHGEKAQLLASFNDVPFFRCEPNQPVNTQSGVADHLLVPGKNTLTLEVRQIAPSAIIYVQVYRTKDEEPVLEVKWPAILKDAPKDKQTLPFVYTTTFLVEEAVPAPVFLDAPSATGALEHDEELWAAIRRVQGAYQSRDIDRILEEESLRTNELQRAYPREPSVRPDAGRQSMSSFFNQPGGAVTPLERDQIRIRSCSEGRVAYVTRKDGRAPLRARSADGRAGLDRDMWFTRHEGGWRLFR